MVTLISIGDCVGVTFCSSLGDGINGNRKMPGKVASASLLVAKSKSI